MAFKKNIKNTGKDIGHAFKNFGKAMGTTFKVAFGDEENIDENGNSKTKESWKAVGKGFGQAGKDIGHTAKDVFVEEEEKKENKDISKEDAIDVEPVEKKEEEK